MKKFLLITYYWPPAGGGGVMRWVKMTKYIKQYGWEPIVYTPENGETAAFDPSLVQELAPDLKMVKTPIWEPYQLYKRFSGRKKEEKIYSGFINENQKESLTQKISVFIRGNFFIPDARMFWIKPSIRFLKQYLQENPVDAIVSTGPPHSMHLIAEGVHQATGIPWIADFRDPWTNIDFYKHLRLTKWADARHKKLEHRILSKASRVVAVTWRSRDEFVDICGRQDIAVITNGFDDADFPTTPSIQLDTDFSIAHIGSMNQDRNPEVFWKAVKAALESSTALAQKLKIRLIGPTDYSIRATVQKFGLEKYTEFIDFVPHAQAVQYQQQSQVLLLLMNDAPSAWTIIPGKLYEYLGSRRPLLAIGPKDSDMSKVIEMTQGGVVHNYDDVEGIKQSILDFFAAYTTGQLQGNTAGIEQFTRRNLASKYADLLSETTK